VCLSVVCTRTHLPIKRPSCSNSAFFWVLMTIEVFWCSENRQQVREARLQTAPRFVPFVGVVFTAGDCAAPAAKPRRGMRFIGEGVTSQAPGVESKRDRGRLQSLAAPNGSIPVLCKAPSDFKLKLTSLVDSTAACGLGESHTGRTKSTLCKTRACCSAQRPTSPQPPTYLPHP